MTQPGVAGSSVDVSQVAVTQASLDQANNAIALANILTGGSDLLLNNLSAAINTLNAGVVPDSTQIADISTALSNASTSLATASMNANAGTNTSNMTTAAADNTTPSQPVITTTALATNDTTPTINGTAEPGATVTLYETDSTTRLGSTTVDNTGNWSITSATLVTGAHTLAVKVTDTAGNVSTASTTTVTVDTTPPSNQDTVLATSVTVAGGRSVAITSSGAAGNSVWLAPAGSTSFITGNTITKAASGTATTITAPVTGGNYKLFVIDAAGNVSAASTATVTVDATVPTVSSHNPGTNATNVAVNAAIDITFSEPIDTKTVTPASFTVTSANGSVLGNTAVNHNSGNNESLTHPDLAYGTTYTVNLANTITDMAGNALAATSWNFTTEQQLYSIGGTVTGLPNATSVVLQNNGGDNLAVSANGAFTFATKLMDSSAYAVTVLTVPSGLACSVTSGAGSVAGANITGVVVDCSLTQMGGALQGNNLPFTSASANVSTFAGTAGIQGNSDGTGATASFSGPNQITTDGTNLFVADQNNSTIRKIDIATGAVTTFAGTAGITGSADGTGTAASFSAPMGITTDGANLFVADAGNALIRKIDMATGAVTTIAGTAGITGSADGIGVAASFAVPFGVTTDGTNVFVTDAINNNIRKIDIATGVVTTLAGMAGFSGSADGTGTAARFSFPEGITTDGSNLFVVDGSNNTIRKIVIATGAVTTLAGTANAPGITDGTGAAARFNLPVGVTTDGTNLFVGDSANNIIRKIVISSGDVTTIAGQAGIGGSADGTGTAAMFNRPYGVTTDGIHLFVTDYGNNTVRRIQ